MMNKLMRTALICCVLTGALSIHAIALGSLDLSFGSNGAVYSHLNLSDARITLQSDGKILKYGTSTNGEIHIYRYNANGTPDLNFGSSGRAIPYYPLGGVRLIVVQSDGKIVAAGSSSASTVYVWRFNANGTHDTGFGTNGRSLIVSNSFVLDMAVIRPNTSGTAQNVVIVTRPATTTPPDATVMRRLNANGTINTSFGNGGVITLPTPGAIGVKIVMSNGSLFQNEAIYTTMVRNFASAPYKRVVIAKYTGAGQTDTTFGISGEFKSDYALLTTSTVRSFKRTSTGRFYVGVETSPFTGQSESRLGVHTADGALEFLSEGSQIGQPIPHTIYGFRADGSVVGNHFNHISRVSADLTTVLEDFDPSTHTDDGSVQSDNKLILIDTYDTIRRYQP